ncbi:hypothetical protein BSKO_14037 [Bryopsis sp. KO-2023]|nr:hypothetical protein BSKO_14037 [Bryopsis sp. KO-2023]
MFSFGAEMMDEEEEEEPLPARLDSSGVSQFLTVGKDKLTVSYKGNGQHPNDVGSIRSNKAVPSKRRIYYYEVSVLDEGERRRIGIGFADKDFKLQRQPGWDPNSFGYHGDDGRKYCGSGVGEDYAPTFTKGDVIGAGIHLERQEIFFTKNGKFLKVAFERVQSELELYPTIGLHSKGEQVEVNFGGRPFRFDLEGMLMEENERLQRQIRGCYVSPGQVHQVVRMYLLHYGYADTLRALDDAAGLSEDDKNGYSSMESREGSALDVRREVRRQILSGDIDAAIGILQQRFPELLDRNNPRQDVAYYLYCQKYVELVRNGMVFEAVRYAQDALFPFRANSEDYKEGLIDVMAVVAYVNPEESPQKHLLTSGQREMVADVVNAAMLLSARGRDEGDHRPVSVLERLLRQLVACHRQMRSENRNQGEVFKLKEHLLPPVTS